MSQQQQQQQRVQHTTPMVAGDRMPTTATLEIENIELQATVDSQEELITRISEDLRNVHYDRDFIAEIEILDREQQNMDLKEQLAGKEITIQHLKNELVGSSNITEEVYKKYEG